jgi:transposase
VRVPPKLMADARDAARSYGKSDPIDALAVARAALREPNLSTAQLDGPSREVRLLMDYCEDLVHERIRALNRLRWHLHELHPSCQPPAPVPLAHQAFDVVLQRLAGAHGTVARPARPARPLVDRRRELTAHILALDNELEVLVQRLAPALVEICGCSTLTAGKIVGETADVRRFRSRHAYARHNATAPLPSGPATAPPPQPHRHPSTQRRHAPHRDHTGALPP